MVNFEWSDCLTLFKLYFPNCGIPAVTALLLPVPIILEGCNMYITVEYFYFCCVWLLVIRCSLKTAVYTLWVKKTRLKLFIHKFTVVHIITMATAVRSDLITAEVHLIQYKSPDEHGKSFPKRMFVPNESANLCEQWVRCCNLDTWYSMVRVICID